MLTRAQILGAADNPAEEVEVPEWGGSVFVRGMTGGERDRFDFASFMARDDLEGKAIIRARIVAWCTVDETGKQLFTQKDVETLGGKSGKALDRVFTVAQRLSGIGKRAVEEAERDFSDGPSGSSSSDSPATSGSPSESSSPDVTPPSSRNGRRTNGSPALSGKSASTS